MIIKAKTCRSVAIRIWAAFSHQLLDSVAVLSIHTNAHNFEFGYLDGYLSFVSLVEYLVNWLLVPITMFIEYQYPNGLY